MSGNQNESDIYKHLLSLEYKIEALAEDIKDLKKVIYGNGHNNGLVNKTTFLTTVVEFSKFTVQIILIPILFLILKTLLNQ